MLLDQLVQKLNYGMNKPQFNHLSSIVIHREILCLKYQIPDIYLKLSRLTPNTT
ncbi:MAG: hypothetical protein PWQ37_1939 [Candidatus Petromonas sp.]|jgi:hypothetical protein|nr:hypothetical protein [Candidatus Petromonas sp.]